MPGVIVKKFLFLVAVIFCVGCKTTDSLKKEESEKLTFLDLPINYKTKKDIMIIFTGSDWDEFSQKAGESLFTQEFFEKYYTQYDIYNVDIVRNSSLMSESALEKSYQYFSEYDVTGLPTIALETNAGSVYALDSFETYCGSLESFDIFLQEKLQSQEKIIELEKKINESEGYERTIAIDEFLKNVKLAYSTRYSTLIFSALESDPENKSGLKKEYLLRVAELKAVSYMNKDKVREAADEFLAIVEDPLFADSEKQGIYYTAAYFLASQEKNTEEVLELLNKALSIAPKSELAPQIQRVIKTVSKRLDD